MKNASLGDGSERGVVFRRGDPGDRRADARSLSDLSSRLVDWKRLVARRCVFPGSTGRLERTRPCLTARAGQYSRSFSCNPKHDTCQLSGLPETLAKRPLLLAIFDSAALKAVRGGCISMMHTTWRRARHSPRSFTFLIHFGYLGLTAAWSACRLKRQRSAVRSLHQAVGANYARGLDESRAGPPAISVMG